MLLGLELPRTPDLVGATLVAVVVVPTESAALISVGVLQLVVFLVGLAPYILRRVHHNVTSDVLLDLHSITLLIWLCFLFTVGPDVLGVVEHLTRLVSKVKAVAIVCAVARLLSHNVDIAGGSDDGLLLVLVFGHHTGVDVHDGAVALQLLTYLDHLIRHDPLLLLGVLRRYRVVDQRLALRLPRSWWNRSFLDFLVPDRLWVLLVLLFDSWDLGLHWLVIVFAFCNEAVSFDRRILMRPLPVLLGSTPLAVFLVNELLADWSGVALVVQRLLVHGEPALYRWLLAELRFVLLVSHLLFLVVALRKDIVQLVQILGKSDGLEHLCLLLSFTGGPLGSFLLDPELS